MSVSAKEQYQTVELWDRIASDCSLPDLKSLSLVSRYFTSIAQRQLFHDLTFRHAYYYNLSSTNSDDENAYFYRQSRTMLRLCSISFSDRHRPFVRSWSYAHAPPSLDYQQDLESAAGILDARDKQLFETFIRHLPSYSNLRSLHLSGVTLDPTALATITALPALEVLKLFLVEFRVDAPQAQFPSRLRLKQLELHAGPTVTRADIVPIGLCIPEYLESMMLVGPWDINPFLHFLAYEGGCPNLRVLTVALRAESVPLFFRFLEGCQSLADLTVRHIETETIAAPYPLDDLSPHACPKLMDIRAPAYFIWTLVPGRPVRSIEIDERRQSNCYRTLEEFRLALHHSARSRVDVEDLQISTCITPWAKTLLQDIVSHFPRLQTLCFLTDDLVDDDDMDEEIDFSMTQSFMFTGYGAVSKLKHIPAEDFPEGYAPLLADIALGSIELPTKLYGLEMVHCSSIPLGPLQEREIVHGLSGNPKLLNLCNIALGNDWDVHRWTRTALEWQMIPEGYTTHIL